MISLSIFALLGILEFLMLVVAVAVVFFFKWRGAQQESIALQKALKKRPDPEIEIVKTTAEGATDERSYAEFLQEQLEQSSVFLGEDSVTDAAAAMDGPADDPATLERQMLAARHQFLQLELDVQALTHGRDVETRQKKIVAAMQALLKGLRVESPLAEKGAPESGAAAESPSTALDEETKLRDQIVHLRSVIDNQHEMMRDLRSLLESEAGDSNELQAALRKLDNAEKQSREMNRCLEVMDQENERLKHNGKLEIAAASKVNNPDSDMLRDLVGSQQRTIADLQQTLKQLVPDTEQAQDLNKAIDKIQRTNNELNSCVMVLEDENSLLRGKVEELKHRISEIESHQEPSGAAVPAVAAAAVAAAVTEASSGAIESAHEEAVADSAPQVVEEPVSTPPEQTEDVDIDALLDAAAAQDEVKVEASAPQDVAAESRPVAEEAVEVDEIDELLAAAGKDDMTESVESTSGTKAAEDKEPEPAPAAGTKAPSLTESETDQDDIDALLADLMGETDDSKTKN